MKTTSSAWLHWFNNCCHVLFQFQKAILEFNKQNAIAYKEKNSYYLTKSEYNQFLASLNEVTSPFSNNCLFIKVETLAWKFWIAEKLKGKKEEKQMHWQNQNKEKHHQKR